MLVVFAVVALTRVALGDAPHGYLTPSLELVQPLAHLAFPPRRRPHPHAVHLLGLGHLALDQRGDEGQGPPPGLAGISATVILLVIYLVVTLAAQAFAGEGTTGIGLLNPAHAVRRHLRPRHGRVRLGHHRLGLLPPPPFDGAYLRGRLRSDDDPADRPHGPLHGRLQGVAGLLRQGPPAVPHADGGHPHDGGDLGGHVRRHELPLERQRHRRLRHRHWHLDRLLLRPDGLHLHLVLPQGADPQRAATSG